MKSVTKLLLIAVLIPVLMLLPLDVRADGDDDPPHGIPDEGGNIPPPVGDLGMLMRVVDGVLWILINGVWKAIH